VEVVPLDPTEQKRWQAPNGLFSVGIGAFWPLLLEEGLVRKNRYQAPRPKVRECHVMAWLLPRRAYFAKARSAFSSPTDVHGSIEDEGLRWLSVFQHPEPSLALLKQGDWEIFCTYPLMRGLGSKSSTRRLLFLASLAYRLHLGTEVNEFLRQAEIAIQCYPENLRPRYRKWFDRVSARIRH
jgi:hypothetical protein